MYLLSEQKKQHSNFQIIIFKLSTLASNNKLNVWTFRNTSYTYTDTIYFYFKNHESGELCTLLRIIKRPLTFWRIINVARWRCIIFIWRNSIPRYKYFFVERISLPFVEYFQKYYIEDATFVVTVTGTERKRKRRN